MSATVSSTDATAAGRLPPANIDAEASLLGAMLLSRDAVMNAVEVAAADDFYRPAHAHVFEAIASLYSAGLPVDTVTVAEELDRAGLLEEVGGAALLISLQANTPATSNAARYAKIIEERAMLRRLIGVAGDIAELGYSVPSDVAQAVDTAEALVYKIAERKMVDSMAPVKDLLEASLDRLEMLYDRGEAITGVPSGYHELDELTAGLQPGAMIVVGARPAMGKTSFALGICANAALSSNRPVIFFSLEMSQLEVTQRLLCADARVDASKFRNGRLNESDWGKVSHAVGRLAEAPIYIDDNPHLNIMEIRSKARRLKSRTGDLGLVVLDYVQLMTGRPGAESRQIEVSEISRGLKILAREVEAPVMALAQLNRGLEQRADKRPMLSDLRESGSLEQDADVVMFIYRDEVYNEESPDMGTAEIIIAKHRSGPTGTVKLAFLDHYTLFANMGPEQ